MNIKLKPFAALLAMAALVMTGCKDDVMGDLENNGSEYNGKVVHVTAGIALPSVGTRSATDDPEDSNYGKTNSDEETDWEFGYDYENEIRTMILLYTDKDDNYITHSVVTGLTKAPVTGSTSNYDITLTAEVKHDDLYHAYMDTDGVLNGYDPKTDFIHVYAFCNYTDALAKRFENANKDTKNSWRNWRGHLDESASGPDQTPHIQNTIWAERTFLMTNAKVANVKFPATIGEWDNYADKSTPWQLNSDGEQNLADANNLEPIQVERTAARIDFRDASKLTDLTYRLRVDPRSYADQVKPYDDEEGTGKMNLVSMELTRMALTNMSNEFYYLRRVSDDGKMTVVEGDSIANFCGIERKTNYVVDWDWSQKSNHYTVAAAQTAFNFPLYTGQELQGTVKSGTYNYNIYGWYRDNISKILSNPVDTWSGYTLNEDKSNANYHIWRYVTENTIPKSDDPVNGVGSNQITVQSVGVVFRARIKAGDDVVASKMAGYDPETKEAVYKYISQDAIDALENVANSNGIGNPILYSFENRLFAGPEDIIIAAAKDGEHSTLYGAVSRVLSHWVGTEEEAKNAQGQTERDIEGNPIKRIRYDYVETVPQNAITLDVSKAYKIILDKGVQGDSYIGDYYVNLTDANFRPLCPFQNIAVYEAESTDGEPWGYYCYYFYWNRHNDNQKGGLMGPMEFATVRNNVYKLSVTSIGRLGHPTKPTDDPDPEKPNDPDEPPTNYMQVHVEVLPWVVRVNNITF